MPPEQTKFSISRLEHRENGPYAGNYAITIDGKVFGYINAQTNASFNLVDLGGALKAGTHKIVHRGRDLKVEVKDIKPETTFYDLRHVEANYREQQRTNRRTVDPDELKVRLKNAQRHNDETMAEILGRVVVTEA